MSTVDRTPSSGALALAWPAALAAGAVLGSLAAACMLPFVGLAVAAAATMDGRRAAATVAGVWGINQLLGFGVMGYPWTGDALLWGGALLGASLAAAGVARAVVGGRDALAVLPLVGAFALAFAAYEALLFALALVAGGTETFAWPIVLQILVNDASWFAGLVALHILLTRAAPRLFGRGAPLSLA